MSQNALKFEEFLQKSNINLEKTVNDDLTTFIIREQVGFLEPTKIAVMFNNHDGLVNIVAYQWLKNSQPEKHQQLLELLNELNLEYTFIKYTVKDNLVTTHISAPFMDNYSVELTRNLITTMINVLKKDYGRIMKMLVD